MQKTTPDRPADIVPVKEIEYGAYEDLNYILSHVFIVAVMEQVCLWGLGVSLPLWDSMCHRILLGPFGNSNLMRTPGIPTTSRLGVEMGFSQSKPDCIPFSIPAYVAASPKPHPSMILVLPCGCDLAPTVGFLYLLEIKDPSLQ